MSAAYTLAPSKVQEDLPNPPYDRWVSENGETMAEFHRDPAGFRVRFPDDADFVVDAETFAVSCEPVEGTLAADLETLWHNAMVPLLDNHRGGTSLHGSACVIGGDAVGFVAPAGRGKTTLAAACALAGNPFLAEDAIRLEQAAEGYAVLPARPVLRLCADSAAHLIGAEGDVGKRDFAANDTLPHHPEPARLRVIYLLGDQAVSRPAFTVLGQQTALAELMRHAFILDIEDKPRLAAHFERLARLASAIPVVQLDYPRRFDDLSEVVSRLAEDAVRR